MVLKIRARAPPVHNSSALDCREWNPCELDATVPAWEQWYYILVERYLANSDVYFRIGVQVTGEAFTGIPSVFVTVCVQFSWKFPPEVNFTGCICVSNPPNLL